MSHTDEKNRFGANMSDHDADREKWHYAMLRAFAPFFERLGHPLPIDQIRIGVGYTSTGRRKNSASIGECLFPHSEHKNWEITIRLDQKGNTNVASTLLHELIHAALPQGVGHKKPFKDMAFQFRMPVDSTGRSTCKDGGTTPEFDAWLKQVMDDNGVGPYPHYGAPFGYEGDGPKKPVVNQTVRFKCKTCSATASQSKKWFEKFKVPLACNNQEHDFGYMEIVAEEKPLTPV